MDYKQLKVGNYVRSNNEIAKVVGIRFDTDTPCVLCDNSDVWRCDVEAVELDIDTLERLGFGISDDKTYGLLRTTFYPYGELNVAEYEDYAVIDLRVPQSSIVKHQYMKHHKGFKPSLLTKSFEGEILYLHELQNVMETVGCSTKVEFKKQAL